MNDDVWLRELAQVKRDEEAEERARLDERWDRLSAGELSPEEDAGLRALAETSEEAREAYEAFRPLGPDFHARVVNAVRAGQEVAGPPPRVLPFRPARLGGWLTAAAAVAAVLVLFLRTPASPPLPGYTVAEMDGGIRTQRGEPSAAGMPVFMPGSRLTLVVKPPQAIADEVEARSFLSDGSRIDPWRPDDVAISRGIVRLEGTLGDELPAGSWKIWVVVGRPGSIPSDEELMASLRAGRLRDGSWQAVPADLRVEARPPS